MPIMRCIEELKIAEQVPPSLENRWNLDELYQREVDRERVRDEIVRGYLADPSKLKFFNALTVVLMPKDEHGRIRDSFEVAGDAPAIPWTSGDPDDEAWSHAEANVCNVAGLQYVQIGDNARLRWDSDRVHAVAVDGQHRLVALQEFYDSVRAKSLSDREQQTKIPIIFLLLLPEAGFRSRSTKSSIRAISRELFTDLNKNAKPVDEAREVVLDDWSVVARCVRTLITEETAKGDPERLPLSLVRWQDANARFDASYYLNSLTHLYSLVASVIRVKEPTDPLDKADVEKFIDQVDLALAPGSKLSDGQRTLIEYYRNEHLDDDHENAVIPLSRLPHGFLNAAIEGFERYHRPWLLQLLTRPAPYRRLLEYAEENDLVEGDFGKFWAQTDYHRQRIRAEKLVTDEQWYATQIQRHVAEIEEMKGRDKGAHWCFKVIFQRAMVRLARLVAFANRSDSRLGGIDGVIETVDLLDARGLLLVGAPLSGEGQYGVWAFLATNPVGGKIKVNKKVENRIYYMLLLWHYARIHLQSSDAPVSGKQLVAQFEAESRASLWPEGPDAVRELLETFHTSAVYGADVTDEKTKKEKARSRLVALMDLVNSP
ncbi:MAG: hypothetical protein K1X67_09545 [Fimbriimonadaceae bacterium]|nr:hypothetical protein [Fimbriimonadaceae bacterium]